MPRYPGLLFAVLCVGSFGSIGIGGEPSPSGREPSSEKALSQISVDPVSISLHRPESRFSLLVQGKTSDGLLVDLTQRSRYRALKSALVSVSDKGIVRGLADGKTAIEVTIAGQTLVVPVEIHDSHVPRQFHFKNDIVPIFNRFGCNTSGCHGKAEGQNGFKLSVFGFEPAADYAALTHEGRGRRVFPASPAGSLLLRKASGEVPHGGGVRIRRTSDEFRTLRDWIAAGMPRGSDSAPHVVSIKVSPGERRMAMKSHQQLRVVATFSDGHRLDVTAHTKFQSNNEGLAKVDPFGLVTTGENPGEVAVMVGYMNAVDVYRALIPLSASIANYPKLPVNNFIDGHVVAKLRKLNIIPSEVCSDSEFLRRVFLDLIGTLPTTDEARTFLADKRPDRRARLVDTLLVRPEFADFWAMKWSDLLRVDRQALGHKGAYNYYRWIRDSFAANKPYDKFVRELVTAEGVLEDAPSGHLYRVVGDPGKLAGTMSQVFFGVRIACAQCHHHPFDRWSQTDYFGMQAYFTQVSAKSTPRGSMTTSLNERPTKHPRSGAVIFAHPLGSDNPQTSLSGDRRKHLADWMTSPKNPWFAQNLVNRTWAHMLGRGIIEPVDDVRSTNPPTNPELLAALARDFADHSFDFHHLLRTITASRTYQLSSKPNDTNLRDEQNYSRALFKRLDAEVLFDAICQTTGVSEKFRGVPAGSRAIQLWDSQVPHYFLKLFGRPNRVTPCQCERTVEPSVSQVLHVLNSPKIHNKLSHEAGQVATLVDSFPADDERLIEALYLTFYSRRPSEDENNATVGYMNKNSKNRRRAAEDIAWSMMNTVEFLFNH